MFFCCTRCKKRYLRLVDAIYPRPPMENLVTANMTKLTFYSITHPENLNKIGGYLLYRLDKDLKSQNYVQVKVVLISLWSYGSISGSRRGYELFTPILSHLSEFIPFSGKLFEHGPKAARNKQPRFGGIHPCWTC